MLVSIMKNQNSFSHLTLEERRIILAGITNCSTKTAIAQTIGKDKSTVGKEIKLHRSLTHKCKMPLECNHYKKCVYGRQCFPDCPEYSPFHCSRRDRSSGACNGCSNWPYCRFDKYQYCPEDAQMNYRTTLIDSRQGVNLTVQEAKQMAAVIAPLLKQGSPRIRSLQTIPNPAFQKKLSTTISKTMFFMKLPGLPLSICDARYHANCRRKKRKLIRSAPTESFSRAEPTKIIVPIALIIPRYLLLRWTLSITMRQTAPSFRHLNL